MTLAVEQDALSCAAAKSVGTNESLADITIVVAAGKSSGQSMRECQQNLRQKVCIRNSDQSERMSETSHRKCTVTMELSESIIKKVYET